MYNSDLAYQRYQHVLNQARRTQIPVPYDLDSPVTHSLNDTRDPWIEPTRPQVVRGVDIDGHEIDCHPNSLAALAMMQRDYNAKHEAKDFPTRYAETKEPINSLTRDIIRDHSRLIEINEDSLIENVEACATALVMDGLKTIKAKVELSPKESLHVLQVLNDIVEVTAHTVSEFEEVFDDLGLLKNKRDIVTDAFESSGKDIDAHIRKLWDEINS